MPQAAPKPCAVCGSLVRDGSSRCATHTKKVSGFTRQTSRHARGYGSAWVKLRQVVLQRDCGLCQVCKSSGRARLGTIVDHIVPKSEEGTDDLDNLQTICSACHTSKTALESARGGGGVSFLPEWLPKPVIPVFAIAGPPGSGKSLYVTENASPNDLVLDVDCLAAEITNKPLFHATREEMMAGVRLRNRRLADLASNPGMHPKAWLIATAGRESDRAFWAAKFGRPMHVMSTPKALCIERIKADVRRPEPAKLMAIEAVLRWT